MGSEDDAGELEGPRLVERPIAIAGSPDESLSAELGSMRHPWWHWVGGGAALLVVLFTLGVIVPEEALRQARNVVEGCRAQDMHDEVDPESCVIGSQFLAALSPKTREQASYLQLRSDYEYARHRVYALTRSGEGGERREELFEALRVAAHRLGAYYGEAGSRGFDPAGVLLDAGAYEQAAALTGEQLDADLKVDWDQRLGLLVAGDFEHLRVLATRVSRYDRDQRERAALSCLFGDVEVGAKLFEQLRESAAQGGYESSAGLLAAACTGAAAPPDGVGYTREAWYWRSARELARTAGSPAWGSDALTPSHRHVSVLAQSVVHERPSAALSLRWLSREGEGLPAWVEPSERALAAARGEVLVPGFPIYDPATLVAAAQHMAEQVEAAEQARAQLPKGKPDAAWREAYVHGELDASASLAHVAGVMALEAGVELTARHEFEAAREALQLCLRVSPRGRQIRCAQPLLTAGGREAALAWTEARRAELLERQHMTGDEYEEYGKLALLALELHARAGSFGAASMVVDALDEGKVFEHHRVWEPERLPQWKRDLQGTRGVPYDEAFGDAPIYRFEPGLLPLLVRDSADIDSERVQTVLKRGLSEEELSLHGQRAMWARAQLARRWGLAEEEQRWLGLLSQLRALARDEDDWLLLHSTGLWAP